MKIDLAVMGFPEVLSLPIILFRWCSILRAPCTQKKDSLLTIEMSIYQAIHVQSLFLSLCISLSRTLAPIQLSYSFSHTFEFKKKATTTPTTQINNVLYTQAIQFIKFCWVFPVRQTSHFNTMRLYWNCIEHRFTHTHTHT